MAQTTANLLDHVVPRCALRQFVLTVPHALRARLAFDGPLLGAVGRIFVDSVLGWYRRRMKIEGAEDGQSGAVTVVQRTSADLKLHPHFHAVFIDGVFVTGPDGKPVFRTLPRPWHELMRRSFQIDVETCARCSGKMRLVALVRDADNIARYLRHLGEPTDVPPLSPARGPPYWQSTVLRRRYGDRPKLSGVSQA